MNRLSLFWRMGGVCAVALLAARAGAFDIKDYFPLAVGNVWQYTGQNQLGSTANDDFSWTIPAGMQAVAGGAQAFRIVTTTVDVNDARNTDEDFWRVDPAGRLLLYGFKNGKPDSGSGYTIPAQTILTEGPLLFGRNGLNVGDIVTSKTRASVSIQSMLGTSNVPTTITLTVNYDAIEPVVITPAGWFTNALHLVINIEIKAIVVFTLVTYQFEASEFWLARDVGMVKQDQKAQPDEARQQALTFARVGNALYRNAVAPGWQLLE